MHKKTEARVAKSKPKVQASFGQGPTHSTFVSFYLPRTSCSWGKVTTRLAGALVLSTQTLPGLGAVLPTSHSPHGLEGVEAFLLVGPGTVLQGCP